MERDYYARNDHRGSLAIESDCLGWSGMFRDFVKINTMIYMINMRKIKK